MAGSKVFQFFLLISLMIFSTHALSVYLTEGIDENGFDHRTKINVRLANGLRHYNGCVNDKMFVAKRDTKKVVVYIRNKDQMERDTLGKLSHREALNQAFHEFHYELLYLIVYDFHYGDERVISEFLQQSIRPDPNQSNLQIDTIGEGNMKKDYRTLLGDLAEYEEDNDVFEGRLYETIRGLYRR